MTGTRQGPTANATGLTNAGCTGCGRGFPPVSYRQFRQPILGSPGWVESERYTIDARAEKPTTPEMMRGPMMQALLEDRFRLKVHQETRAINVYEMTVTGGSAKLQASVEGSCIFFDPENPPARPKPAPRICGSLTLTEGGKSLYAGTTVAGFCRNLSLMFDHDVIDKTGIAGFFDILVDANRVTVAADDTSPTSPADRVPPPLQLDRVATFHAFQRALLKVGLRLELAKGAGVVLVIDRVERPLGN